MQTAFSDLQFGNLLIMVFVVLRDSCHWKSSLLLAHLWFSQNAWLNMWQVSIRKSSNFDFEKMMDKFNLSPNVVVNWLEEQHSSLPSLWVCFFGKIRKQIIDPRSLRSWCIKGTEESFPRVNLGSMICFWIFPKKHTVYVAPCYAFL